MKWEYMDKQRTNNSNANNVFYT